MHKSTTSILGMVRSRSLTQGQGHTLRSWDSVAGDLAVLQTPVLYFASLISANFVLSYFFQVQTGLDPDCVGPDLGPNLFAKVISRRQISLD